MHYGYVDFRMFRSSLRQACGYAILLLFGISPAMLSPAPHDSTATDAETTQLLSLETGSPIEGHLAGKETHSYWVELQAGRLVTISLDSQGVDSAIRLYSPDGVLLMDRDSVKRRKDPEELSWVTGSAGRYRVEVLFVAPGEPSGPYRVILKENRDASETDRYRVGAEAAVDEALRLRALQKAESLRKAVEEYENAARLWRAAHDAGAEAEALNAIGLIYRQLGDSRLALAKYKEAIELWRQAGDKKGEVMTLTNIGKAHDSLGETVEAIAVYEQALILLKDSQDDLERAFLLNNLGATHDLLGDSGKALDYYQEALRLWRGLGDLKGEASALNNVATVYWRRGAVEKAIELLESSLKLRQTLAEGAGEAATLANLGTLYAEIDESEKARSYFDQALSNQRIRGDRIGQIEVLSNLANLSKAMGNFSKALDYHEQALTIQRTLNNPLNEALLLHTLGDLLLAKGDQKAATTTLESALALWQQTGDREGEAKTLRALGTVYGKAGKLSEAKIFLDKSLKIWKSLGNPLHEASTLLGLARIARDRGDLGEALSYAQNALDILESLRAQTASQILRTSLSSSAREYYDFYVECLMESARQGGQGALTAALYASERARARSLLEAISETSTSIRHGADPGLLAHEASLQQRINHVERQRVRLFKESPRDLVRLSTIERDLDDLLRQLDAIRTKIRFLSPKYAALTQPESLRLEEIQTLLDPGTLLLSYFLGEDRAFVWAVTRSSMTVRDLASRTEIEAATRELHALLSQSDQRLARRPAELAAMRLARMLLGPVESLLGKNRLVIVADGALSYVPFAALPVPGRYKVPLIVEHEIVNLPSASVLAVLRRETADRSPGPRKVAVLADPVFDSNDPRLKLRAGAPPTEPSAETLLVQRAAKDVGLDGFPRLRYSREEAEGIASLLPPGEVFKALDFDASKETATGGHLARYRILHFATHGLLDTRRPELSGLVLSLVDREGRPRDGFLRLHEIYNLDLPSDLVVLSGCETALGKEVRGEGLIALTRGFMYAGAPSVVASLWRVDDRSTAELMRRFYRALLKQSLPPAAALRAAQVSLWKERPTEAPYFWAGFVFQGDWR